MKTRKLAAVNTRPAPDAITDESSAPRPVLAKLIRLRQMVDSQVRDYETRCAEFADSFAKNPAHALTWGANVFGFAARLSVAQEVSTVIPMIQKNHPEWTDDQVFQCIVDQLTRDVLNNARNPSYSTSVQSNVMDMERNAAKARLIEDTKYWD